MLQLQGAAANMSVTQMKQFVANDLRAMKTQSKAVALQISASEVRSCLQNLLFFRAWDRNLHILLLVAWFFLNSVGNPEGKRWLLWGSASRGAQSGTNTNHWRMGQLNSFSLLCGVQVYVCGCWLDLIVHQDVKILGKWRSRPRHDLVYRRLHRATKTNQPLTQTGGLSLNEL